MVRGLDLPLRSAGPVEATRLIPGLVMLGAYVPMPFSFGVVSRTHQPSLAAHVAWWGLE